MYTCAPAIGFNVISSALLFSVARTCSTVPPDSFFWSFKSVERINVHQIHQIYLRQSQYFLLREHIVDATTNNISAKTDALHIILYGDDMFQDSISFMAVSYTHLDVYKRQLYSN